MNKILDRKKLKEKLDMLRREGKKKKIVISFY